MATRPRIGVTGDHHRWAPSWWCLRLALFLIGARARRISVRDPAAGECFDAVIISGGNDIGPELYGGAEMPKAVIDRERDELEIGWINRALEERWPLLGICRGAQLLNAVLGGSLAQDIRQRRRHTSNRASIVATKNVALLRTSYMSAVCKRTRLRVNSLHHQAIDRPGLGLRIVGRDRDGICQAIEGREDHRILGVQWHPEYLFYLPVQLRIFRWLIDKAHDKAHEQESIEKHRNKQLGESARRGTLRSGTKNSKPGKEPEAA
jgi:putative glutamine amidotransferase